MAEKDLIQNLVSRLGQSQDERLPAELDPDFFRIDDRDPATLLAQARALAAKLRHYAHDPEVPSGDWSAFFPEGDDAALLARDDGGVPPHLGLFAAFLELYKLPQAALNRFTARHLDFQYRDVLRFAPRPAEPDHAHVLLELKKGAAPLTLTATDLFSAGRDEQGAEMLYRPVRDRDVVIGHARVEALHSVFRDASGLFFAPVADSADGLGAALDPQRPSWRPFGGKDLAEAPVGFALASPVLKMQEGRRDIRIELDLSNLDPARQTGAALAEAFAAHVTGPKGWIGPLRPTGTLSGKRLTLSLRLEADAPAVVDYDAKVHGLAFAAHAPVVQLLLSPEAVLRYGDIADLAVGKAAIQVEVQGLQALTLENDNGSLNPKKAFQPFGPQPVAGSRFMVGSGEALGKRLLDLQLSLKWQGAPADLAAWYADYQHGSKLKSGVAAQLVYADRDGAHPAVAVDIMARDAQGVSRLSSRAAPSAAFERKQDADERLFALLHSGSALGRRLGQRTTLSQPHQHRASVPAPSARAGFITVALESDFLHADYRRESLAHAVAQDKIVLNEPYTPTVQGISLDYSARSDEVDLSLDGAAGEAGFTSLDLQFFHVGSFGQRREHAFLRRRLAHVADKAVCLLPAYPDEGELLIGLSGVAGGDGVSLLFQVAEGSADPELKAQPVTWSVLCDNHWRPLSPQEMALDTSRSLRASGIVAVALPAEADSEHTWMPSGLVWLRAAIARDSGAACRLLAVAANAVEVCRAAPAASPALAGPVLPAKRIAKLKNPLAAVKKVAQPYPGFGGRREESAAMLTRRAAERLRHRDRCIGAWDYERLLLEAFPAVHKVKCVPHASERSWLVPGHVLLVVIPDRRHIDSPDPLRPRVDIDTLTQMREYARARCGMQVEVAVKNPRYLPVRLDFKVRFRAGLPFAFYRRELEQALIRRLSPWAFDTGSPLDFGGRLYRSVLLDFVEKLDYVDFVTDFRMGLAEGGGVPRDVAELAAEAPDVIFVSDSSHDIAEYPAS